MEEDLRKFQRLLRLLQYLSTPGGMGVKRLAEKTGVDIRTIYRDLDELRDACFDIVQDRNKGPYRLNQDYTALGQTLTLEEVLCLGLSSCVLQKQLGNIGRDAMRKLHHFIKGDKREGAQKIDHIVQVQGGEEHTWIPSLMKAVSQRQRVRFTYTKGEPVRTLDPYTLFYQNERWFVQGFDHLRQDLRSFRLARMTSLEILDQFFLLPNHYDPQSAFFHKWDIVETEPTEVLCKVDPSLAAWLQENSQHPSQKVDGELYSLKVRDLDALAHWLLGLRGIEVLSPPELRQLVREKALDLVARHPS